jgi:hypothetical protein
MTTEPSEPGSGSKMTAIERRRSRKPATQPQNLTVLTSFYPIANREILKFYGNQRIMLREPAKLGSEPIGRNYHSPGVDILRT